MLVSAVGSSLSIYCEGAKMSSSEQVRASPRDNRYITLHLYLPSGEFVVEDVVPIIKGVERYVQDLEEGLVTPKLGFDSPGFVYELVWNDKVLNDGGIFKNLVEDHGMSVDEPVDVIVILKELHPPVLVDARWMGAA